MYWWAKPEQGESRVVEGTELMREGMNLMESLKHDFVLYREYIRSRILGRVQLTQWPANEDTLPQDHDRLLFRLRPLRRIPPLADNGSWAPPRELHARDLLKLKALHRLATSPASDSVPDLGVENVAIADFACLLKPMEWLNDEIINAYVDLINQVPTERLPFRMYCWSTFFFTRLLGENGQQYDYNAVRRWTKRRKIDIFALDLMFIPLHINTVHWSLAVVDFRTKLIFYFDSLNHPAPAYLLESIRHYLADEWADKKGGGDSEPSSFGEAAKQEAAPPFDEQAFLYAGNNFTLSTLSRAFDGDKLSADEDVRITTIPLQNNGSDCGVFACMFMRELALGRYPFQFSCENINLIRLLMVVELCRGEIMIDNAGDEGLAGKLESLLV